MAVRFKDDAPIPTDIAASHSPHPPTNNVVLQGLADRLACSTEDLLEPVHGVGVGVLEANGALLHARWYLNGHGL